MPDKYKQQINIIDLKSVNKLKIFKNKLKRNIVKKADKMKRYSYASIERKRHPKVESQILTLKNQ